MEHTLDQFGKEKITPHPTRTAAIVLAAGQGKRMKSKIQKQFLLLEEKPVIWYALHAFEESRVDDVILVTGADEIGFQAVGGFDLRHGGLFLQGDAIQRVTLGDSVSR